MKSRISSRQIIIIVAIVVAVLSGVLAMNYLRSAKPDDKPVVVIPLKPVVVSLRDIPLHAKITPDMVVRETKPEDQITQGSLDDTKDVIGNVALVPITANTQISATVVGAPGSVGITGRLTGGLRAVTIPVDMVKAVAGLIQSGDRVDVLSTVNRTPTHPPSTYTILRGVLVLALNTDIGSTSVSATPPPNGGGGTTSPQTVTLAVTAQQADLLDTADANSTLHLALRSPDEGLHSQPTEPLNLNQDVPNPNPDKLPSFETPPPFLKPTLPLDLPKPKPTQKPVDLIEGDQDVAK